MTIFNLSDGTPHLGELLTALENLQANIRIGVRDQAGALYRIQGALYDSNRMALVFQIDTTQPIILNPV